MLKKIAAKAIIWNSQNKVLIVHKVGSDLYSPWEVPGGRLGEDELLHDGLKRELSEELGITDLLISDPVGADEWTPVKPDGMWHIVCVFFDCTAGTDTIVLSDEHDDCAWVLPTELDKYDIAPRMRQLITNSYVLRSAKL